MNAEISRSTSSISRGAIAALIAGVVVAIIGCVPLGVGADQTEAAKRSGLDRAYASVLNGGSVNDVMNMTQVGTQPGTIAAWIAFDIAGVLVIVAVILFAMRPRPTASDS